MSTERLARLRPLVVSALERAAISLSDMAGIQIEVTSSLLELVPLTHIPSAAGSAEAVAVGVPSPETLHVLLARADAAVVAA